jgi:hypothetical protein
MAKPSASGPTKSLQDAFLAAYVFAGSIKKASEAVDISRYTVSGWISKDVQGFRVRFEGAKDDFKEYLQDMAVDRVKSQKPGDNPVLLITLLNAHWPEKYRKTGSSADGSAKEVMGEWKKWVKENRKQTTAENKDTEETNVVEEAERIIAKKSSRESDG